MIKRVVIVLLIVLTSFTVFALYRTLAYDTSVVENTPSTTDLDYTFQIGNSSIKQLVVEANETRYYDVVMYNPNPAKISYGIYYEMVSPTTKPDDYSIVYKKRSRDKSSGVVSKESSIQLSIEVVNNTSETVTVKLGSVAGYVKGGELSLEDGQVLIPEEEARYYMKGYDTSFDARSFINDECLNVDFSEDYVACLMEIGPKFLNSNISSSQVSTISVVKSSEIPSGVGSATDISRDQDNSVLLYSKTSAETGYYGETLYDLYIATENGKVFLTSGAKLFAYMVNLKNVNLVDMYTDDVTDMSGMFAGCVKLQAIDTSNFNTSNVNNMQGMFVGWAGNIGGIESVIKNINLSNFNTSKVTDMSYMFYGMNSLTTLDISEFNTSNVTDMKYMFYGMTGLTTLDVNNFNTSNVTNMSRMFCNMSGLTTLDVGNFNTSNVNNMQGMFSGMTGLKTLDVSNFNTSNVTDMSRMFDDMTGLKTLDVSNFDTSNVTDMSSMFYGMTGLKTLDVSNFNTSKVFSMASMFSGMTGLTTLDLSDFNTSKVNNMNNMFREMSELKTIYVSNNFSTSALTSGFNMFTNCKNLVGGNGTRYNSNYADNTYARIDKSNTPGYFTLKS